VNYRY